MFVVTRLLSTIGIMHALEVCSASVHYPRVPERRLPVLETAGFDLLAQVEGMLRQVRLYQREVQRIRDLVNEGKRDQASALLTEGGVVVQMEELRRECTTLTELIDVVESMISDERGSRSL